MTRIEIRVLKGLCPFIMRLHIKGGSLSNLSPLYTFVSKNVIPESDISAVNLTVSW